MRNTGAPPTVSRKEAGQTEARRVMRNCAAAAKPSAARSTSAPAATHSGGAKGAPAVRQISDAAAPPARSNAVAREAVSTAFNAPGFARARIKSNAAKKAAAIVRAMRSFFDRRCSSTLFTCAESLPATLS